MSDVKQVIVVRKDLQMRKGKIAAQVAHASMKFLVDNNEAERGDQIVINLTPDEASWLLSGSFTKIVVGCDSEDELRHLVFQAELSDIDVYPIVDSGKTEFDGIPTLTCAAFGPCTAEQLDRITGNLKLILALAGNRLSESSSGVERCFYTADVAGSIPVFPTRCKSSICDI